jgi:hypothetical protein
MTYNKTIKEQAMTDQEREKVLKMIENGKITPEDGLKLIQALDENPVDDESPAKPAEAAEVAPEPDTAVKIDAAQEQYGKYKFEEDPQVARIKSSVRRLWQVSLWIGVVFTILSAWGMYLLVQSARFSFWFYCLCLLLLIGVLLIVAAAGSRKARWIFVDVRQKPGERPARIFLGFPLPLKLVGWFLCTFGHFFPDLKNIKVDEMIQVIESGFTSDQPLVVNVDEGEQGDRVQVYIG